ncbi:MAG: response regulator [Pelobium sp.]
MTKKSIWIADDDPDDRMIIREAFEENHYAEGISFFEDGEKVLLRINEEQDDLNDQYPDLFILDLNMPKVNGVELLTWVKQSEKTKHIPVVIFTTSSSKTDKEKVIKLGADEFITKPIRFELMLKITKELIEKYG